MHSVTLCVCCVQEPTNAYGEQLRDQVEERLKFYDTGDAPRKNIDVMSAVAKTLKQMSSSTGSSKKDKKREKSSGGGEEEEEEGKKKKKDKKDKKRPREEDDEPAAAAADEGEKKKKKKDKKSRDEWVERVEVSSWQKPRQCDVMCFDIIPLLW